MASIAVFQMNSGIDPEANFAAIAGAAQEARRAGAEMLFTPEMALLLDQDRQRAAAHVEGEMANAYLPRLADLAKRNALHIALGSMPVALENGKWANRSFLFSPADTEHHPYCYDKIHMFDVDLASGESWRESNRYQPGVRVVTIEDTPVGRLGLTICYDLRFPALFEALGRARCDTVAIPAAFTRPTGKAHWHVLLRARAIEASAYVIAAAQVGQHEDGRETYGHSLVIDPWGDVVLDMGGERPGLGVVEIDLARIAEVRAQIPSLANRRPILT